MALHGMVGRHGREAWHGMVGRHGLALVYVLAEVLFTIYYQES